MVHLNIAHAVKLTELHRRYGLRRSMYLYQSFLLASNQYSILIQKLVYNITHNTKNFWLSTSTQVASTNTSTST